MPTLIAKVASQYPTSEKSSPIARRDVYNYYTSGLRSHKPVFGGLLCACASEVRRYTSPGVLGPQAEGRPEGSKAKASTTASSVPLLHHEAHTQKAWQHASASLGGYEGMQVNISRHGVGASRPQEQPHGPLQVKGGTGQKHAVGHPRAARGHRFRLSHEFGLLTAWLQRRCGKSKTAHRVPQKQLISHLQ